MEKAAGIAIILFALGLAVFLGGAGVGFILMNN